jgi:hypothetical protein
MRTKSIALCITLVLVMAGFVVAQSGSTSLSGKITCAKCDLKTDKDCATVIVVNEGGKDVVYYLDDKAGKANHSEVCSAPKEGTVTGTVSEKGGKKTITASRVDFKK